MERNIQSMADEPFDIIIIGGGIHGAATAWQCSLMGAKVALVEKEDFGSVTSANSLKIIHGGFRYLQHLNIKRMRESILSRRIMSQISPENVVPLRCTIPTSGYGLRSLLLMQAALWLNDGIAYDRNQEVLPCCNIPGGRVMGLAECRRDFPDVDWTGKTGGAVWYDALALNSERLTLAFIQEAVEHGASVANYTAVDSLNIKDGRIQGIAVRDLLNGEKFHLEGSSVIVAAGADNDRILGKYQGKKKYQDKWARAVNIVIRRKILKGAAIGLTGEKGYQDEDAVIKKQGRFFFFVPWREYTMIGTTYSFDKNTDTATASSGDIRDILQEVNTIFPRADIRLQDVCNAHCGLVPAYSSKKSEDVQLVKETRIADLSQKNGKLIKGLFAIQSVKYTTAPIVAIQAAEKVKSYLGKAWSIKDRRDNFGGQHQVVDDPLWKRYGKRFKRAAEYIQKDDEPLCQNPLVYAGEVEYFVQEEMARTLPDAIKRRSEIGSGECPERGVLLAVAGKMAQHLNWDEGRIISEVEKVEKSYRWG